MRCDWHSYTSLLPLWMRNFLEEHGKDKLLELRLRLGYPPELVMLTGSVWMKQLVTNDDINFCLNTASRYSPWAAASISNGFITAPGGHRLGLCGNATVAGGSMTGIRSVTSICLRVARDFPGIASDLMRVDESILIIGKPGSGKTTLLRDLIRQKSDAGPGSIAVVDEKSELFPFDERGCRFHAGMRTDVMTGCSKEQGIDAVLRNMGPEKIAVDEITAPEDCNALLHAGWCGVQLFATAHAADLNDLFSRKIYRPLVKSGIFETVAIIQPNKSYRLERMRKCL